MVCQRAPHAVGRWQPRPLSLTRTIRVFARFSFALGVEYSSVQLEESMVESRSVKSVRPLATRASWFTRVACAMAVCLVCQLSGQQSVFGVIVNTVTGTGNTTAPSDNPGWENVGVRGIGTGVYLGNLWVLTASHVGGGDILLGGATYTMAAGTGFQLTNAGASGKSTLTDLYMYQLTADPGLPALRIATSTPALQKAVTMVGAGLDRGAYASWSVNTASDPYVWTATSSNPNFAGYTTLNTRTMRWGTNAIALEGWSAIGAFDAQLLATTFNDFYPSSESLAATGDSGGAVFVKNGSAWELAGIMLAVVQYSGQPSSTAVFGNQTYSADLSFYNGQIVQVVPEPSGLALAIAGFLMVSGLAAARTSAPVGGILVLEARGRVSRGGLRSRCDSKPLARALRF